MQKQRSKQNWRRGGRCAKDGTATNDDGWWWVRKLISHCALAQELHTHKYRGGYKQAWRQVCSKTPWVPCAYCSGCGI
eukprot:2290566-Amphidinium_carterae.1